MVCTPKLISSERERPSLELHPGELCWCAVCYQCNYIFHGLCITAGDSSKWFYVTASFVV